MYTVGGLRDVQQGPGQTALPLAQSMIIQVGALMQGGFAKTRGPINGISNSAKRLRLLLALYEFASVGPVEIGLLTY